MTNLVKGNKVDKEEQVEDVEPEDDDNGVIEPDDGDILSHSFMVKRLLLALK